MAGLGQLPVGVAASLGTAHRIGGAAVLGALLAVVLLVMWNEVDRHHRGDERYPLNALGRFLMVACLGPLVVLAGVLAGFAWLGVPHLLLAAPAGVAVTGLMAFAGFYAIPGGRIRLALAVLMLLAAGLALVTAAAMTSRPWLTELALVMISLAAAVLPPPLIRYALQYCDDRAALARLRFPLMVPDVTGYQVAFAHPDAGTLLIEMRPQGTPPDQQASDDSDGFSVQISAATHDYQRARLADAINHGQPAGQDQWILRIWGRPEVIARRRDLIITASFAPPGHVPLTALLQATADLHPVTSSTIMSIWSKAQRPQFIFNLRL